MYPSQHDGGIAAKTGLHLMLHLRPDSHKPWDRPKAAGSKARGDFQFDLESAA